jgi:hypothetical protein
VAKATQRKTATVPRKAKRHRSAQTARPRVASATAPAPAPARIARIAKGKKPQYFSDPAIDKLLWMNLTLMEELSVVRDRLDTVERLLDRKRLVRTSEVESFVPAGAVAAQRDARRTDYVDRVLRAAQAELEEITRRGMPASDEEVVAAVAS